MGAKQNAVTVYTVAQAAKRVGVSAAVVRDLVAGSVVMFLPSKARGPLIPGFEVLRLMAIVGRARRPAPVVALKSGRSVA